MTEQTEHNLLYAGSGATTDGDSENSSCQTTKETIREEAEQIDPQIMRLKDEIIAAIKTVYDPEIPVDIYELGLIYRIDIDSQYNVVVDMTLTAPGCPVAGEMPLWVESAVAGVQGIQSIEVNMVFDPPWNLNRMSEIARVELNMF
jgi:FeS assembly SUF system protein